MAADKKLASIGQLISHVAVKQEEEWLSENLHATDAEFQEFMAADRTPSFKPEAEHSPSDEQLLAADSERLNDSFDFNSAELELNEEFLSDTNDSASTIDPRGNNQRVVETAEEQQAGVGISHGGSELDYNIHLPEDGQFSANTTDSNSASCSQASNERVLQAAKNRQADECSDTCKLCPIVLPKECMAVHMLEVHHAPWLSSNERDILRQHAMVCNGPHKEGNSYRCQLCPGSYKTRGALTRHSRIHDENRPRKYACGQCESKFLDKSALLRHLNLHTREKKYTCNLCAEVFYSDAGLFLHMKRHAAGLLNCMGCGGRFPDKLQFEKHVLCCNAAATSNKGPFECTLCSKDCATQHELTMHYKNHKELPWKCTICAKGFIERFKVRRHVMLLHNMRNKSFEELDKFVCEGPRANEPSIGMEPIKSTTTEVEHSHSQTETEAYEIQQSTRSPLTTNDSEDAETELEEEFLDDRNDTDSASCSRGTNPDPTEDQQAGQITSHEDNRPLNYACGLCGTKFLDMRALDRHLKNHTAVWKFGCRLCRRIFDNTNSLLAHARSHIGQTHNCQRCGARFLTRAAWESHVLSCNYDGTSKKKLYECRICDHNDVSENGLLLHYKLHIGLPWECGICAKGYSTKVSVRNHLAQVHRMAVKSEEDLNKFVSEGVTDIESLIGLGPPASTTTAMEQSHSVAESYEALGYQQTPNNSRDAETELLFEEASLKDKNDSASASCSRGANLNTTEDRQARHIESHEGIRPQNYSCEGCDAKFLDMHALDWHRKTHTIDRKFACRLCQKLFDNTNILLAHAKSHIGQTQNCQRCGARFFAKAALESHLLSCNYDGSSKRDRYECRICDHNDGSERGLKSHYKLHIGLPLECSICSKGFLLKVNVRNHLAEVHRLTDKSEEELNKFITDAVTDIESLIGLDPPASTTTAMEHSHSAAESSEVQPSHGNLQTPNNSQDAETELKKIYRCQFCPESFKNKLSFTRHNRIHDENSRRKYVCEHCDSMFLNKPALVRHLNMHSRKRKFTCNICAEVFFSKSGLCLHMKGHKRGPHSCKGCGVEFPDRLLFAKHERFCKFKCTLCSKDFTTEYGLKKHYKYHNGLPWKCSICAKGFIGRCKARRHLTNVHKMADKTEKELNKFVTAVPEANESPTEVEPIKSTTTQVETSHSGMEAYGIQLITPATQTSNAAELPHVEEFLEVNSAAHFDLNTGHNAQPGLRLDAEHQARAVKSTETHDVQHFTRNPHKPNDFMFEEPYLTDKNDLASASCSRGANLNTTEDKQAGHIRSHELIRPQNYSCERCDAKFLDMHALDWHLKTHTIDRKFACRVCQKLFDNTNILLAHAKSHIGQTHNCQRCGARFFAKAAFESHVLSCNYDASSKRDRYECRICDHNDGSERGLRWHYKLHIGLPLECSICSKGFLLKVNVRNHLAEVHRMTDKSEEELNKFITDAVTDIESLIGLDPPASTTTAMEHSHSAAESSEVQPSHGNLQTPNNSQDAETELKKIYRCQFCPESFKNKLSFTRHNRIHDENSRRKYVCEHCDSMFLNKPALVRHLNMHSRKRKFTCNICAEVFFSKSGLCLHMKGHKRGPHSCKGCGVEFPDRLLFAKHERFCKFKCTLCSKDFTTEYGLKKHYKYHNGLPWKCSICAKGFIGRCKARRHLTNVHKMADKTEKELNKFVTAVPEANESPTEVEPIKSTTTQVETSQGGMEAYGIQLITPATQTSNAAELPHVEEFLDVNSAAHFDLNTGHNAQPGLRLDAEHQARAVKSTETHDVQHFTRNPHKPNDFMFEEPYLKDKNDLASASCSRGANLNTTEDKQAGHIRSHELIRPQNYSCERCDAKFLDMHALDWHLKTHTIDRQFACRLCQKVFDNTNSLLAHARSHIGQTQNCQRCGARFFAKAALESHLLSCNYDGSSKRDRYECRICDHNDGSERGLRWHYKLHIGLPLECSICSKGFLLKVNVRNHLAEVHRMTDKSEEELNKFITDAVTDIESLIGLDPPASTTTAMEHSHSAAESSEVQPSHGNRQTPNDSQDAETELKKIYRCQFCPESFKNKLSFTRHNRIHNENSRRKYACEHCDSMFQNKPALVRHLNMHSRKRKFTCNLCADVFFSKFGLCMHMKGHKRGPHTCKGCGVDFPDRLLFAKHERCCKFKCTLCSKDFTTEYGLKKHYKYHNGLPWKCSICAKGFIARCKARRHLTYVHKMADRTEKELNQFVTAVPEANESPTEVEPTKSRTTQVETSHSGMEAYGIQLITPAAQTSNAAELPHVEEFLGVKNAAHFNLNTGHNAQPGLRLDAEHQARAVKSTETHDVQHFTRNPQRPNDSEEAATELLVEEEFLDDKHVSASSSCSQITNLHGLVRAHDQLALVSISHEGSELCHEDYSKQSMETSHNFTETELTFDGEFSASKNDSNSASCCQETIPDDMEIALAQQTRISTTALYSEVIESETETIFCEICPNTFKRESDLKCHMRSHDVNRVGQYSCEQCDAKFLYERNLQQHLNAHANKKKREFPCRLCERTCASQQNLDRHMRLHTSDTPSHNCHLCGISYASKGSLRRHLVRCHSSEASPQSKRYKCTDCDEEFGHSTLLYQHRKVHTGLPWKCRFCGKKFQKGLHLTKHHKRFHKITDKSELTKLLREASTANEPSIGIEATQSTTSVLRHSHIEAETYGIQLFTPAAPTLKGAELAHDAEFLDNVNATHFNCNGSDNPQSALDMDFEQQIGASTVHTNTETHEGHIPTLRPQTQSDASEDAEFTLKEEFIDHESGILEIAHELQAERDMEN